MGEIWQIALLGGLTLCVQQAMAFGDIYFTML
jgi:hypothetical protein